MRQLRAAYSADATLTHMPTPSGNVFLICAPSGAGKSSLVNALLAQDPQLTLSVSCTTRAPRPGEQDGRHYRFIDVDAFMALRDANALLEWAEVHGNYYGTPRDRIDQAAAQGQDIVLEIDWQGAQQVRRALPQAIGIFILPPSVQTLHTRLVQRGQDDAQVIARRLRAAAAEMAHAPEFEYVIINQEFSVALAQLAQIVCAARLRYLHQATRYAELFARLGVPVST